MRQTLYLILTALAVGCGSDRVPTYPVSGRVVFANGNPVRHGTVELMSVEHNTAATGKIDHDGGFVLGTYTPNDGATPGAHDAIVVQMVIDDGSFEHTVDHGDKVPTKHAAYETSGLTVAVEHDQENVITITIDAQMPHGR
ncbi:carboxypeptidase regulatory-like domain-containing protein [Fuerstiella marisgermanici]|uniref:Carboxypeptidase regulatory-like domain-containing protein n=1 Tax=Fuerstiella marisgermanici TaxID=1891926 RepID=A0A1P8WLH5_9PLAN|nr:carboxypeptidase regulatory-like domain-containing protein [Fuerstiella marisgermanici]APZ94891.1 hypothetical protein Fuma_04541 [Fuerstiella marisgermanici]